MGIYSPYIKKYTSHKRSSLITTFGRISKRIWLMGCNSTKGGAMSMLAMKLQSFILKAGIYQFLKDFVGIIIWYLACSNLLVAAAPVPQH